LKREEEVGIIRGEEEEEWVRFFFFNWFS